MGYVKYTEEQLVERKMAQAAIMAARALLKSLREAKKAKKDGVIQLRRELKAEIRRRKEAGLEARRLAREEKALNKKCKPILVVLRKVYKPYLVARRKLARLRVAKRKAELAADRKLARETAKAAKHQLEELELEYAASPAASKADKAYAADESWDKTDGEVFCRLNYDIEANIDRPAQPVSTDFPPFAFCATPSPQPRRSSRLASHRPSPICV